jgi:CheY-like chemotaxis protein
LSIGIWNHGSAVGCVLVLEPDPEVRELVSLVARRLGLEAVHEVPTPAVRLDVLVLEPESFRSFLAAQVLRERFPELPIIVASIAPPSSKTAELRPLAYLQKPFMLGELQHALARAVPASSSSDAA